LVPSCGPPGGLCPCTGEFDGVLAAGNYRLTSEVSADLERAESIYLNLSVSAGVAVEINVQPRFDDNWIMARPQVPVQVAILGSASVDVLDVDVTTLAFGPDGAAPALDLTHPIIYWLALRDVNDDGETDLVATFLYGDTGLPLGESEACLTGEIGGTPFEACDSVVVFTLGCGLGVELTLLLPALIWLSRRRSRRA